MYAHPKIAHQIYLQFAINDNYENVVINLLFRALSLLFENISIFFNEPCVNFIQKVSGAL